MALVYPPHLLLQISGRLGGVNGTEIWTCGIRFYGGAAGIPTRAQLVTAVEACLPLVRTWFAGPGSTSASAATLTTLKLNYINAQGKQPEQNTVLADYAAPVPGLVTDQVPFYQSFALTFRTDLRRGRGHSGRIFPPCVSAPIGTDGYVAANSANNMSSLAGALLNNLRRDISSALGAPWRPAVISVGDTDKGTAAGATYITGVVVDRVPDVQHKRTNQLLRSESTLTPVSA